MKTLLHIAADFTYFVAAIGFVANGLGDDSQFVPMAFLAIGMVIRAIAGSKYV